MAEETTKQQGGLQLPHLRVSPFGKRCRIALAEKGLAYECLEQDYLLSNKSEVLLNANDPVHKKIPVLLRDGRAITESLIILHEAFPQNTQLLPPNDDGYTHKKVYHNKGEPQAQILEILKTLEGELVEKPYVGGDDELEFTDDVLEPFTAWFLLRYERFWDFSLEEECPRLAAWSRQCGERETLKEQENRLQLARARAPAMAPSEAEKPLRRMAASFEQLASFVEQSPAGAMDAGAFSRACSTVSILFGCLGLGFKFAEMDYVSKVDDLLEASKSISTLPSMVELDIQKDTVRETGSHTRNLLRVKRGIDSIKALFEQMLVTEGDSLRNAAPVAYAQVFGPHHGRAMRMAVTAAMYAIPSRSQLYKKLNEDEESAKVQMQKYVSASAPVILYVEDLFTSRNLGIDW